MTCLANAGYPSQELLIYKLSPNWWSGILLVKEVELSVDINCITHTQPETICIKVLGQEATCVTGIEVCEFSDQNEI